MFPHLAALPRFATGLALGMFVSSQAVAQDPQAHLAETIQRIEQDLDARVGLVLRDSGSDWSVSHRADEPVLMNSTVKAMLCGAVLDRVDDGTIDLGESLKVAQEDILEYAPVTETAVGGSMTVGDLCLAALDMSDNTATNLLIERLGGPQEVTAFLRDIGDPVSRLDRMEPELNTYAPDDLRDTTTPEAMAFTLEELLLGDALSAESRAQLTDWMSVGSTTGAMIRAGMPDGWDVADKSGSGDFNRNIAGMVTPPDQAPYFFAIYLSGADADFDTRNAAVIELSAAVADVLTSR